MGGEERDRLRRRLYDDACAGGVLRVSPRAKFDPERLTEQSQCKHKYEDLRWGGNGTSLYAGCRKCGLKSVILYTEVGRKGDEGPKGEGKGS